MRQGETHKADYSEIQSHSNNLRIQCTIDNLKEDWNSAKQVIQWISELSGSWTFRLLSSELPIGLVTWVLLYHLPGLLNKGASEASRAHAKTSGSLPSRSSCKHYLWPCRRVKTHQEAPSCPSHLSAGEQQWWNVYTINLSHISGWSPQTIVFSPIRCCSILCWITGNLQQASQQSIHHHHSPNLKKWKKKAPNSTTN